MTIARVISKQHHPEQGEEDGAPARKWNAFISKNLAQAGDATQNEYWGGTFQGSIIKCLKDYFKSQCGMLMTFWNLVQWQTIPFCCLLMAPVSHAFDPRWTCVGTKDSCLWCCLPLPSRNTFRWSLLPHMFTWRSFATRHLRMITSKVPNIAEGLSNFNYSMACTWIGAGALFHWKISMKEK